MYWTSREYVVFYKYYNICITDFKNNENFDKNKHIIYYVTMLLNLTTYLSYNSKTKKT